MCLVWSVGKASQTLTLSKIKYTPFHIIERISVEGRETKIIRTIVNDIMSQ